MSVIYGYLLPSTVCDLAILLDGESKMDFHKSLLSHYSPYDK